MLRLQLAFLLAASICWTQTNTRPSSSTPTKTGQEAKTSSDLTIQKAIQERFAKSKIAVNKFQVRVEGGIATIGGATDVIQHKGTATRLARNAGAKAVVNNVKISDAAKKKAADRLTGVRSASVKRSH